MNKIILLVVAALTLAFVAPSNAAGTGKHQGHKAAKHLAAKHHKHAGKAHHKHA